MKFEINQHLKIMGKNPQFDKIYSVNERHRVVIDLIKKNGSVKVEDIKRATNLTDNQPSQLLTQMRTKGIIKSLGRGKGWVLVGGD